MDSTGENAVFGNSNSVTNSNYKYEIYGNENTLINSFMTDIYIKGNRNTLKKLINVNLIMPGNVCNSSITRVYARASSSSPVVYIFATTKADNIDLTTRLPHSSYEQSLIVAHPSTLTNLKLKGNLFIGDQFHTISKRPVIIKDSTFSGSVSIDAYRKKGQKPLLTLSNVYLQNLHLESKTKEGIQFSNLTFINNLKEPEHITLKFKSTRSNKGVFDFSDYRVQNRTGRIKASVFYSHLLWDLSQFS